MHNLLSFVLGFACGSMVRLLFMKKYLKDRDDYILNEVKKFNYEKEK